MAASNAQPFEVEDFSGGITDHVHEQRTGVAAELTNFLIGGDKKPASRMGSEVDHATNAQVPSGTRVSGLFNYANSDKLFYQSLNSMYYRNPSVFTELLGPGGNPAFSTGIATSVPSVAQWNRHLYLTNDAFAIPMKVFKDGAGVYQLRNSGLPALASTPTISKAPGAFSYIYAFHYAYDYTVFDLDYESVGPVAQVAVTDAAEPSASPIVINGIPVLANGPGENHDLANIKIFIFRTTADGTFLRKVGQVTNGTTTFSDSMSDVTMENTGVSLYINDGTVDYDPPPLHKFNHVVSNTGYYAHLKDELGNISPYKIRQSIPGVPDTGPIDFETFVDDEIEGISSVHAMPMVFCKKFIYRIDQFFDQFGRGGMIPVRVSDRAGCISHQSIVQAENGVFWFGNDGVYFSNGYNVQKVSDGNNDRYKVMLKNTTQANRIVGRFWEKERLITWGIQTNSANHDNDTLLVCDLKWGVSERMTFTTWNGRSFRPSALEVFNNDIYRGDIRGYTFRHDENLTSDPKIDIYKSAAIWVNETIIWQLKTINYNFGGTFFRKYPTRILLTAADAGNTTIQITAINDDGRRTRQCKVIRNRRDFVWRDDDFVWRISDFIWRGAGLIEQWRRFPAGGLRLSTLQLVITNGYSDITNSDTLGTATFSSSLNTAVLDTPARNWPLGSEDYFIATEVDGYVKEYLITSRDSNTQITVNDPANTFPTGSKKWVIRGYKKDEPLHLLGFNIHWTNVSQTQQTYHSGAASTGENA